jgi:hypothetical protein
LYFYTDLPLVVTDVAEESTSLPWTSFGIALTSLGNLVVVHYFGTGAKVYDSNLNYMNDLDVTGQTQLFDVASKDDILFIVDAGINKVHVMRDNNVYMHAITVSIGVQIYCTHVHEFDMYVPSWGQHKLFHLGLDSNYNKISGPTEIISSGLNNPGYVYADSNHIVVNSLTGDKLMIFPSTAGDVPDYTYSNLDYPHGVYPDNCGTSYVLGDRNNKRVVLVSPTGTFLAYLATGTAGGPTDLVVAGNVVYFVEDGPSNRLVKLTVT